MGDQPPTSLFRPLTRRPTATTVTVKELNQKVQAGEIRIPDFQRPLRWGRDDVVALLDSIWRGYPIGSLLLWKRPAEKGIISVGSAHMQVPEVAAALWVVDGQQRTTALAASLLDLKHGEDLRWGVRFDPERELFLPGAPPPDRAGLDVPGSVIGDLRRLGRWIRENAVDEGLVDRIEVAQQRVLDYAIPAYVVDFEDEQALRAAFARLNSTGKRMRSDEVFQALLGGSSDVDGLYPDLDVLQKHCDVDSFGQPPRAEILKAVMAMSGFDPTRRLEDLAATNVADFVSREDAAEALSMTVEFLVHECGIPHVSLIPYPVVFFILARWFHIHSGSEPATRALLARWVWRGAVTGVHERAEVSRMREQVRDIRPGDEQGSLDRLLERVKTPPRGPWELTKFNLKSARSRIEILALLNLSPRDHLGPISVVELVSSGDRIAREIIAHRDWKSLEEQDKLLAQSAANRVILGSAHSGLGAEIRRWNIDDDLDALSSHLIDKQAHEALKSGDVGGFLRRRTASVRAAVEAFVQRRAAWDEPNIRPLEVYFDEGDA